MTRFLLGAVLLHGAAGLDNGVALTPPMGWRSWNCYQGEVSAAKIMATIDAITSRARTVAGFLKIYAPCARRGASWRVVVRRGASLRPTLP